jgi:hypothetical protein
MYADNINILWALQRISPWYFSFGKSRLDKTTISLSPILATCPGGFPFWPQRMNTLSFPCWASLFFRSFLLFKNRNHAENNLPGEP